jgi:Amt family ammonium transporter
MSEEMTNIYDECIALFPDAQTQTADLIQCISDGNQEWAAAETASLASGVDTFYLIFAGALVYFMQTGFAMLTAGSIRSKNVKNVLLWNLLDSCGGGMMFWICGWAFAYGGEDPDSAKKTFVGNTDFFLRNSDTPYATWFFQFAFACALSSIVAGTVAERCKMQAYLFYSAFLVGFVYPVVAHSFWSVNGWLSNTTLEPLWGSGAIDLAGSGPVHMCGGVTALASAIILGPRIGRFYDRDGNPLEEPHDFPPHSVALQFLGTFCLWFGWYGFNPGSVLQVSSAGLSSVAALVAVNTTLGACAAALSAMFTSTIIDERRTGVHTYDLGVTMNGCLTGLVSITAGAATVDTWAAVLIGVIAGWVYIFGSYLCVKLRIDDAVDAIPVHMCGGAWGVIATGLFSSPQRMLNWLGNDTNVGWFYEWGRGSGNFTLIGIQLIAVLFIFAWTFTCMYAYFWVLNFFNMLRIDPLEEEVGMDLSRHKGSAYDMSGEADMKHFEDLSQRRASSIGDSSSRRGSRRSNRGSPEQTKKKEIVADEEQPNPPEQPAADVEVGNEDPASADKTA